MNHDELGRRSRDFAIEVLRFCLRLEQDPLGQVAQPALLRAGTRQATQYRAACRSRSEKEFGSRLAAVIHDLDIAEFWLEALLTLKYGPGTAAHQLHIEAQELRATLTACPLLTRSSAHGFGLAPAIESLSPTNQPHSRNGP